MTNITALIAVRDDGEYLANCLRHLNENKISYLVIDNGLDELGREVLEREEFRRSLIDIVPLQFRGSFALSEQIAMKQALIGQVDADWIIHLDVDEIMHSYIEGEDLSQAIARLDASGATVVNFEEFVFLPVDCSYIQDRWGVQALQYYYFFAPSPQRLMRAFKKGAQLGFVPESGRSGATGHAVYGDRRVVAAETFALRHYIVRDQQHALRKYRGRIFAADEIAWGWHHNRVGIEANDFLFPATDRLLFLENTGSRNLDRSQPVDRHYWAWGR